MMPKVENIGARAEQTTSPGAKAEIIPAGKAFGQDLENSIGTTNSPAELVTKLSSLKDVSPNLVNDSASGNSRIETTVTGGETPPKPAVETAPLENATPPATTPESGAPAGAPAETAPADTPEGGQPAAPLEAAKPPTSEVAPPAPEPSAMDKLQERIAKGDTTVTAEEYNQFRDHKEKERLSDRVKSGEASASEYDRWKTLNNPEATPAAEQLSEAEQLSQEMKTLGESIKSELMSNGELDPVKIQQFNTLRMKERALSSGLTPEEADNVLEAMKNPKLPERFRKQLELQADIRDSINEIISLQAQIAALPDKMRELRKQKQDAQAKVEAEEVRLKTITAPDKKAEQQAKIGQAYMKVYQLRNEIILQKNLIPILNAQFKETRARVRRQLGMTSPLRSFVEWADAELTSTITEVSLELQARFSNE